MSIRVLPAHFFCALLLFRITPATAQQVPDAKVFTRLTHTRNTFVRRADEEGYKLCPAPRIQLGDPKLFGHYDPDSNTILVATWSRLVPEQRQRFENLAVHAGRPGRAQAMFEDGIYRWVFVHELGRWWQGCRRQVRPHSYGEENGANRIALAFWREQDPRFMLGLLASFGWLESAIPSPVPAGQSTQISVAEHFPATADSRPYTWYRADMVLELAAQVPPPSFHKALSQPLYPW